MNRPEVCQTEKSRVRDFWNRNVCQADRPLAPRGTREFFEEVEGIRYRFHYHLPPWFEKIHQQAIQGEGRVLEIGCGMGTDLLQLARKGLKVSGIDLTEAGIELARQRFEMFGQTADLRVADAEQLPFPDGVFDAVYSFGVLHHTPDTKKALGEVWRVLKNGGTAYVMLYHRRSLNYLAHRVTGLPFDGSKRDRCPVERAYTLPEIYGLLDMFQNVHIDIDYLYGTGWGVIGRLTPKLIHRPLGKLIGWHAMIEAKKEAA